MKPPRRFHPLLAGTAIPILVIVLSLLVPGATDRSEQMFQTLRYQVRGERPVDPSIVIMYFDNEDIASLGGWPLKRSYYALLVDALRDLDAASVGIDISFSEPDLHGPEQDNVLAAVLRRSGRVVLGAYFEKLGTAAKARGMDRQDRIPARFTSPPATGGMEMTGEDPVLPIPTLLDAAAGIGHTNYPGDAVVPPVIRTGNGRNLPALGLAMFGMAYPDSARHLASWSGVSGRLNFPGDNGSLRLVPAIRFLQSYDQWKTGGGRGIDPASIRGHHVLIGVIAEGRSAFVATPFTSQYPSIGLHAVFLDNLMHGLFLHRLPAWISWILALVCGLVCALSVEGRGQLTRWSGFILLAAILLGSYLLFARGGRILPVAVPLASGLGVTAASLIIRHRAVHREVAVLTAEKTAIARSLQEKETRLRLLEQQIGADGPNGTLRGSDLLEQEIRNLNAEIARLRTEISDVQPAEISAEDPVNRRSEFEGIVYGSRSRMAGVVELVRKVADSEATVLILGESGTGKELVAQAVHKRSGRSNAPFVAVNCGALTETLLESELFGYERGAFTGAVKAKPGRFELADGGTIFLDEIGETSEAFQVRLLRVLQDGTFERVGGTATKKVDVRIVAATNRDLLRAVEEGEFRQDLYYRLNVVTVSLPPLRDRPEDLPFLVDSLLTSRHGGLTCSAGVMSVLAGYPWKGNVRELQSVITRAVLNAKAESRTIIRLRDLPEEVGRLAGSTDTIELILQSLREKGFTRSAISETADELGGLNRGTVAEHFRGYCFEVFRASGWDMNRTVTTVAGRENSPDAGRVERKIREYLSNAVEFVDHTQPLEMVLDLSKPKFKNLPQKYHAILTDVISSAHRNEWSLPA